MISIIVPFNNGEKYLNRCLQNLSMLNYKDFEVILIDDFSEDNSESIFRKWISNLQYIDFAKKVKYYYTTKKTIGPRKCKEFRDRKSTRKIYYIFRCG